MANKDDNTLAPLVAEEEVGSETDEPPSVEEQLDDFRQRWHQELLQRKRLPSDGDSRDELDQPSIEEQAKYFFLLGVKAEQNNQLYEAIGFYRRAVQLVPDIEFRIEEIKYCRRSNRNRQESESSISSLESGGIIEEDEEDFDIDDLLSRFQRLKVSQKGFCEPGDANEGAHISCLPVEVLMYIFKWVVSNELDTLSADRLALVCRGFYLCARDDEIWRLVCHRVWGVNCGRPSYYGSWRNMFIQRPHVRFSGCYISKMSYYRQGERGLDNFYKPYHLVEYYRYIRFFPEGQVVMLTTPDDPQSIVSRMRYRGCKIQGILHGYYKMAGDQVTAVMKRRKVVDYLAGTISYYRYRKRHQNQQNQKEETYHTEFQLQAVGKRSQSQLVWNHYSIHTLYKQSGQELVSEFELNNHTYPPMVFSRVKSYTSYSESPLM